jgi:hypothetical protein
MWWQLDRIVVWDWELILSLVGLTFLIALGLWCILKVKRWGQSQDTLSPQEELASHQSLLEQGLLTQEEFDRVRARLEGTGVRDQETGIRSQESGVRRQESELEIGSQGSEIAGQDSGAKKTDSPTTPDS